MIPPDLTNRDQWVIWQYSDRGGKPTKVPYWLSPTGIAPAKSNDPLTWMPYAKAVELAMQDSRGQTGIGYVFSAEDPFVGIDLDNCLSDTSLQPVHWAAEVVGRLGGYAEVSPSQTGVKVWVRGHWPGSGRKRDLPDLPAGCGEGSPAIEVYGSGRYFCVTGWELEGHATIGDGQPGLDWLAETYFPQRHTNCGNATAFVAPQTGLCPPSDLSRLDIIRRAEAYLAAAGPAVEGQGGDKHTFRLACTLVIGFGLTAAEAIGPFLRWNDTCLPPWQRKDLERKLALAEAQPGDRGRLLVDPGWTVDGAGVPDFADLIAQMGSGAPVSVVVDEEEAGPDDLFDGRGDPGAFPEDLVRIGGIIGAFRDWVGECSWGNHPELAISAGLCLVSTLVGRKVWGMRARPNIYIIGLAPSASGKDAARKCVSTLLTKIGAESLIGGRHWSSGSAIYQDLIRKGPVQLWLNDEVGKYLESIKKSKSPWLDTALTELTELFTSSDQLFVPRTVVDPRRQEPVLQPHGTLYGTSQIRSFYSNLSAESLANGFLGRILAVEVKEQYSKEVKRLGEVDDDPVVDIPQELLSWASAWFQHERACAYAHNMDPTGWLLKVPHSRAAADLFNDYHQAIRDRQHEEDEAAQALWGRSAEKVAKLALLQACASGKPGEAAIDAGHVEWGKRLVNWCNRKMLHQLKLNHSETPVEEEALKILRAIRTKGRRLPGQDVRYMTQRELTRCTQWLRARDRMERLASMLEAGLIWTQEVQRKRGPTATAYCTKA